MTKIATTTTLTLSPAITTIGTPVTATVSVSPSPGEGSTVTISASGVSDQTVTLDSAGTGAATFEFSVVGETTVTATYGGDGTYDPSVGTAQVVVDAAVPGAPSGVSASAGVRRATVSWEAAAANGAAVTSYTVTSSPGDRTCTWSSGPLECTVSGLSGGTSYTFTVRATSSAGTGPASAPSSAVTPTDPEPAKLGVVGQPPATMAAGSRASVAVAVQDADGETVTGSTAVVYAALSAGCVLVGDSSVAAVDGVATFSIGSATAGTCTFTFASAGLTPASSSAVSVTKIATTTTVSLSRSSAPLLTEIVATVNVSPSPAAGTEVSLSPGAGLGSKTITLDGSGNGTTSFGYWTPGVYTVTAVYAGDATRSRSETTAAVAVTKLSSSTTVTWDGTSLVATVKGETVTIEGQTMAVPATGRVEFFDGTKSLGSDAVDADGIARISPDRRVLPAGTRTIRAVYDAPGQHPFLAGSTGETQITIPKQKTLVTLGVSKKTLEWGRPLTLTVRGLPADATGTVTFLGRVVGGQRRHTVAQARVARSTVSVTVSAADFPGNVLYSAHYSGDASYDASPLSTEVAVTTTKRPARLSLSFSDPTPEWGAALTVTAAVTPADADGKVDFLKDGVKVASVKIVAGTAKYATTAPGDPGATATYVVRFDDARYQTAEASGSATATKVATRLFVAECDADGAKVSCPVRRSERTDPSTIGRYWYVVPYRGNEKGSLGTQNAFGRTLTELELPGNVLRGGTVQVAAAGRTLDLRVPVGTTYVKKLCTKQQGDTHCGGPADIDHSCSGAATGSDCAAKHDRIRQRYSEVVDDTGALAAPLAAFDFGPLRAALPSGTTKVRFTYTPTDQRYASSSVEISVAPPGIPLVTTTVGASATTIGIPAQGFSQTTLTVPANSFPSGSTLTAVAPGKATNSFLGADGRLIDITVRDANGRELHGPFRPPLKLTMSYLAPEPLIPSVYENGVARAIERIASEGDLGSRRDAYVERDQHCRPKTATTDRMCGGTVVVLTTHLTAFALTRPLTVKTSRRAVLRSDARRLSVRVHPSKRATLTFQLVRGPRSNPELVATLGSRNVGARGQILRFRVGKHAVEQHGLRLVVTATSMMAEGRQITIALRRRP